MTLKKWVPSRVPDLPHAEKPNIETYNKFLLSNNDWTFDSDSIIIGHSSGAVAILGLLQVLPENAVVNKCILVGSFKDNLGWDSLKELFLTPFNFEKIKNTQKNLSLSILIMILIVLWSTRNIYHKK